MFYIYTSVSTLQLIIVLYLTIRYNKLESEIRKSKDLSILQDQIQLHKISSTILDSVNTISKDVSKLNEEVFEEQKIDTQSVESSMQTEFVEESKPKQIIKSVKYYKDIAKQFMTIKRETLKSDKDIMKQLKTSSKSLKPFLTPYETELNKLRELCKKQHRDKLKDTTSRKLEAKGIKNGSTNTLHS